MIREPQFSDHAILRFIERDAGVDVAGFRHRMAEALANPGAQRMIEFAGHASCKITVHGVTYCLRGGTVTTCYPTRGYA